MSKLKLINNLMIGVSNLTLLCDINSKYVIRFPELVLALIQVILEIEEPIRVEVLLSGQQSFKLPTGLLIFATSR